MRRIILLFTLIMSFSCKSKDAILPTKSVEKRIYHCFHKLMKKEFVAYLELDIENDKYEIQKIRLNNQEDGKAIQNSIQDMLNCVEVYKTDSRLSFILIRADSDGISPKERRTQVQAFLNTYKMPKETNKFISLYSSKPHVINESWQ